MAPTSTSRRDVLQTIATASSDERPAYDSTSVYVQKLSSSSIRSKPYTLTVLNPV